MTAPRLRVDLDKVTHNTRVLVDRLGPLGIDVLGVTKSVLAAPEVAEAMVRGGVAGLADSRIQNLSTLRAAGIAADLTLIRTPMLSECDRVVELAGTSFNSEVTVLDALAAAAVRRGTTHGVVLMVELGDLREGVGVDGLHDLVRATLRHPSLRLRGLGTNLACRSGVVPDRHNMGDLSRLANSVEAAFGIELDVVSGGNSANLDWALSGADTGRVTNLRLGEAVLLGREPSNRRPIDGLHTDAVTLVAEVIECQAKPSRPWGDVAQGAFGSVRPVTGRDRVGGTGAARRGPPGRGSRRAHRAGGCPDPGRQQRPSGAGRGSVGVRGR